MFNRIVPIDTNPSATPEAKPERLTLTIADLMEELHISKPTAYTLAKRKDFPSFRIDRRILIDREGLKQWIRQQTALSKKCLSDSLA